MVLVPGWSRPSLRRSAGNHEARIRALERLLRGRGDYVFITEIALGAEGLISFADIPQNFRHLVLEARVGVADDGYTSPPGDLIVDLDHSYTYSPQQTYTTEVDPDTPVALYANNNQDEGVVKDILTFIGSDDVAYFTALSVKFLYYAENGVTKGAVWDAVSYDNDASSSKHSVGGFTTDYSDGDPITQIELRPSLRPVIAATGDWNSGTAYIVGDQARTVPTGLHPNYAYWVCVADHTNEYPWDNTPAFWLPLERQLAPLSKASIYGIR